MITRSRRMIFSIVLAAVLIGELIAVSLTMTASDERSQPWPMTIAVVGDSYTSGTLNRVVWPTLLAQRTGWSVANFALPDAGYVADGRGGYAFTYQVDRALMAHPRIILMVGGLADTGLADPGPISLGALDAINKIKINGPRALVVGPTWYETPVPASVQRVSDAVQKVADNANVPFLSALNPPWLTPADMLADLSGPTDRGQSVIADKIGAWLRSEVSR